MGIDVAVLLCILLAAAAGAWKGVVLQAAGGGSLAAGLVWGPSLSRLLAPRLGLPAPLDRAAAFAVVYLAISLLVFLLALGLRRGLDKAGLRPWDRHAGAVSGAAAGLLLAIALSCAGVAVREDLRDPLRRSRAGRAMGAVAEAIRNVLPGPAREVLDPFLAPLRPDPPGAADADLRPQS